MKMRDNIEQLVDAIHGSNGTLDESDLPPNVYPLDKSKLH